MTTQEEYAQRVSELTEDEKSAIGDLPPTLADARDKVGDMEQTLAMLRSATDKMENLVFLAGGNPDE